MNEINLDMISSFKRFGEMMFYIFILQIARLITVLALFAFVDSDIINFIFWTGMILLAIDGLLRIRALNMTLKDAFLEKFWQYFLFAQISFFIYLCLVTFVFFWIDIFPASILLYLISLLFFAIIAMYYYLCYRSFQDFFVHKKRLFSPLVIDNGIKAVKYLMFVYILNFLNILIITAFIAMVLEIIAYYKLSRFRTLSVLTEGQRRKVDRKLFHRIKLRIAEFGLRYPEISVREINAMLEKEDRDFLRTHKIDLRTFISDMMLTGELRARYLDFDLLEFDQKAQAEELESLRENNKKWDEIEEGEITQEEPNLFQNIKLRIVKLGAKILGREYSIPTQVSNGDKENIRKRILDLSQVQERIELKKEVEEPINAKHSLVVEVVKELIEKEEIAGDFFKRTNTFVFRQDEIVDEVDDLMKTYEDWEDKEKKDQ